MSRADTFAKLGKQPTKKAKQRVRDAFDADKLAQICTMGSLPLWNGAPSFSDYAPRFDMAPDRFGNERFYHFKDNGSQILAVAHLDTVQNDTVCTVVDTAAGLLACSGGLDDRLGAYVILDMLPKLGITCDWLLTTNEEHADSTGKYFESQKDYNWIIEFDRGGTDVVMYQYEAPDLVELVEAAGARIGIGSYSDISELDFLECAAFNWGVGYEDYHSARSHAWLEDTFRMVARFERFYRVNATKYLPFHYADRWLDDDDDNVAVTWDEDLTLVADCGHEINAGDDDSFVETMGVTICYRCGTAA